MIPDGLIDIHCHILPGIDDGARDLEQSVAMARLWAAAGFAAVVATPHFIPGTAWATDARIIGERVAAVQARLDAEAIPLRVYPGMEIHQGTTRCTLCSGSSMVMKPAPPRRSGSRPMARIASSEAARLARLARPMPWAEENAS